MDQSMSSHVKALDELRMVGLLPLVIRDYDKSTEKPKIYHNSIFGIWFALKRQINLSI